MRMPKLSRDFFIVLVLALYVLLATIASADVYRYNHRVVSSPVAGARIPQFIIADTEAELPGTAVADGDEAYTKDTDKLWTRAAGAWVELGAGGGGAPDDATYHTQTPHAGLSGEQAWSLLATGLVLNTTTTGVASIFAGSLCLAPDWPYQINSDGSLSCGQIPFSELGGTATVGQIPRAATADALTANPGICFLPEHFAVGINAAGAPSCEAINDDDVPDDITIDLAAAATALAANPDDCVNASDFAVGVTAAGVAVCEAIAAGDVPTLNQSTTGTAAALTADGTNCGAGNYARGVDASGNAQDCTADAVGGGSTPTGTGYRHVTAGVEDAASVDPIPDADIPNNITIDLAAAATALAADPANCVSATEFAVGVTAAGVATCEAIADADVPNTITVDLSAAASALAADPANCVSATEFAVGVTAAGVATCEAIADADVPNTITVDLATLATTATTANAGDSATAFFSSGVLEGALLPDPGASTNGGVEAETCGGTDKISAINTDGTVTCSADQTGAAGGPVTGILAAPVAVAVSATYVTIFTVTPTASKTNSLRFSMHHTASATSVGMQFRVRSADAGNVGFCAFTHFGINATVASNIGTFSANIAIAAAPGDTTSLASFLTTFNNVEIDCAFVSDGTPGDVILEAQLETGTTSANILAGSSYLYLTN